MRSRWGLHTALLGLALLGQASSSSTSRSALTATLQQSHGLTRIHDKGALMRVLSLQRGGAKKATKRKSARGVYKGISFI